MRRASHHVAAVAVLVCLSSFAAAQDIATLSDVQLIEETREAVGAQDAEAALDLLTEMQRRGTGIFAAADRPACEDVIDLPDGISGEKLFNETIKDNVAFVTGEPFHIDPAEGDKHLRLSFSNSTEEQIVKGIGIIAEKIRKMMR